MFEPIVSWRVVGGPEWTRLQLNKQEGDLFVAALPSYQVKGDIEYFIEAYDNAGNGPVRFASSDKPLRISVKGVPAAVAVSPPTPVDAPEPATGGGPGIPLAPAITAGAGAVLAAVGAILWFSASSGASDLSGKTAAGAVALKPEDGSVAQGLVSRSRIGSILMITGALAGAGGGVWWFIAPGPAYKSVAVQMEVQF